MACDKASKGSAGAAHSRQCSSSILTHAPPRMAPCIPRCAQPAAPKILCWQQQGQQPHGTHRSSTHLGHKGAVRFHIVLRALLILIPRPWALRADAE